MKMIHRKAIQSIEREDYLKGLGDNLMDCR